MTSPAAPSTVTLAGAIRRVASARRPRPGCRTPGPPPRRVTFEPPISITRPPAVRNSGVQPGSVDGATRISPGSRWAPTGSRTTRARPVTVPGRGRAAGQRAVRATSVRRRASSSVPSDSSSRGMCRRRSSAAYASRRSATTVRDRLPASRGRLRRSPGRRCRRARRSPGGRPAPSPTSPSCRAAARAPRSAGTSGSPAGRPGAAPGRSAKLTSAGPRPAAPRRRAATRSSIMASAGDRAPRANWGSGASSGSSSRR